jgi:hypothetical protein
MFKRFFDRLFHRSPAPSDAADLNAFVAIICQDMPYAHELKLARVEGNNAVVRFYAQHPEEFVEVMTVLIESDALPEATIRSMILAVGVAMPLPSRLAGC